jgi:hypothetical protein
MSKKFQPCLKKLRACLISRKRPNGHQVVTNEQSFLKWRFIHYLSVQMWHFREGSRKKLFIYLIGIVNYTINWQMDKTKFTLGKCSFPVFFATNCKCLLFLTRVLIPHWQIWKRSAYADWRLTYHKSDKWFLNRVRQSHIVRTSF